MGSDKWLKETGPVAPRTEYSRFAKPVVGGVRMQADGSDFAQIAVDRDRFVRMVLESQVTENLVVRGLGTGDLRGCDCDGR